MTQISHSGVSEYLECSQKYNLNRNLKIRPTTTQSSLVWGGAIDEGLNELLKSKLTIDPEVFPTPYKAFMNKWTSGTINDVPIDYKFSPLIEYSKKDLDLELFTDSDWEQVQEAYPNEKPREFAEFLQAEREKLHWSGYATMPDDQKVAYNLLCWLSLARKAQYIFEAYRLEVLPKIKKVYCIQEPISLENSVGDKVTGFIDFIVKWEDGTIRVMDNKTTSKFIYYGETSVRESGQLNLYAFAKDLKHAGYIAILKDIKADKRKKGSSPTVKIKIVLDEIHPEFQLKTIEKFNLANDKIKNKEFQKLDDPNKCFFFGKKCPYYSYCHEGGSMIGLTKKEPK